MKKYLITGLIILLPGVLTLMVILFLFDLFTAPFISVVGPLVNLMQTKLSLILPKGFTLFISQVLSLIFLCLFILLLGFITQSFIVKRLIIWGNKILYRIPLIKTIYKITSDMFAAIFSTDGKKAFKRPVMIPFPSKPNFCLGFEVGDVAKECQKKVNTPLTSVFSPTAPHPISGFLFLIPKEDVQPIDMTNEEVFTFLVSCGMIVPGSQIKGSELDDLF